MLYTKNSELVIAITNYNTVNDTILQFKEIAMEIFFYM